MLGFNRRAAKYAWTVALVALTLLVVFAIRKTLFIFLLAVFFAYMVYPAVALVSRYKPRRISHSVASAIVFAFILSVVIVGAILAGPPIAEQATTLANKLPGMIHDPQILSRVPLPGWLEPFRNNVGGFVQEQFASGASAALPVAKKVGKDVLGVAGKSIYLILIPILAFLFIKDATPMRATFLQWASRGGHSSMWTRIVDGLDKLLGRYIRSLLILSATTLVVYSVTFTLAGVPYALLLAALGGVLEFIPVIGPLTAAAVALIVSGVSGYDHLLLLVGFIAVYRLFQDYVLNPYLMSGGVEVPPLMVLFSLLAGEEIGGVVGIFLSVPVLAAARVIASAVVAEVSRPRENRSPALVETTGAVAVTAAPHP